MRYFEAHMGKAVVVLLAEDKEHALQLAFDKFDDEEEDSRWQDINVYEAVPEFGVIAYFSGEAASGSKIETRFIAGLREGLGRVMRGVTLIAKEFEQPGAVMPVRVGSRLAIIRKVANDMDDSLKVL